MDEPGYDTHTGEPLTPHFDPQTGKPLTPPPRFDPYTGERLSKHRTQFIPRAPSRPYKIAQALMLILAICSAVAFAANHSGTVGVIVSGIVGGIVYWVVFATIAATISYAWRRYKHLP